MALFVLLKHKLTAMIKKFLLIYTTAILVCACQEPGYGSLTVNLKDGPADLDEINIDLQSIEVYVQAAKKSGWYKLKTNKGIYNILLFQNSSALVATQNEIPEGKVSLVRLILGNNNSILENNTYYPLLTRHAPGEKFSVTIPADYSVTKNGMLNILLDIDAERSITKSSEGNYQLHPVAVSGVVSSPMEIY